MTAAAKVSSHSWSAEQEHIFSWFREGHGNLVVRARAGCGKTSSLIEAVQQAPEKAILMAAFNKSIANELQSRIPARHIEAKTLHGLGFRFVKQRVNVRVDENGKRAIELAQRACPNDAPRAIVNLVSRLHTKAREVNPWLATDNQDEACDALAGLAGRFDLMPEGAYEARGYDVEWCAQRAHRAMVLGMERTPTIDFADMIFLPLVHNWVRAWFDMVVVDECQDMTPAQLALAVGACKKGGRIAIVGDDRQNLYSFRGTDHDGMDTLKTELDATELGLTTTYRCPKAVVALAAQIVPDFHAAPSAPEGEVATMGTVRMFEQVREGDFVLSRKNAPLVKVCMQLLKAGTRAVIKGRDIGKTIVALVKRLEASDVEDLVVRIDRWVVKESAQAAKRLPEDAAAERISFVHDMADVVIAIAEGIETLGELEAACERLFADDAERSSVMLSTVHRAKGLEAHTVYLLRDTFKIKSEGSTDEQNVLYVAITRAKTRLVWVEGEV